ncbi:hypothetical protein OOK12_31040 [Streptomyces sp. NBC_00452]|uniref:hypothetical protein n=1 Tax=Streptomyces sp. NBC_00452 TaxID=2975746 RepID=UPI0022566CDD|nr:hypothetical protein [Streptomyces sp. NBC_00452]MCX5061397.1 hypothetical protein [Streptomyces sp. NBC_00452]
MNWVRKHAVIAGALLGFVSAVTGIVGWVIPESRDWLARNPGLGWTLAISFATTTIWAIIWSDGVAQEQSARADTLRDEVAELKSRLYPTERDKRKFQELIDVWAPTSVTVGYLSIFNGKQWQERHVAPLYDFCSQWREVFFDDPEFQLVYAELFAACEELQDWMSGNGAPTRGEADNPIYTIADGSEREAGWPEFDQVREEGLSLLGRVMELRREIEREGRIRGL